MDTPLDREVTLRRFYMFNKEMLMVEIICQRANTLKLTEVEQKIIDNHLEAILKAKVQWPEA